MKIDSVYYNNTGTVSTDKSDPIEWTPIGTSAVPYTGIFDVNSFKNSGLYCTDVEMADLFCVSACTLKKLTIENI